MTKLRESSNTHEWHGPTLRVGTLRWRALVALHSSPGDRLSPGRVAHMLNVKEGSARGALKDLRSRGLASVEKQAYTFTPLGRETLRYNRWALALKGNT